MIDYLIEHPGGQTLSGLRCLAIDVIGRAGYGQKQVWSPELQDHKGKDARFVYFKTISLVADRFEWAVFVPTKLLKMPFVPRQLQSLGRHKERMPAYTERVLEEERHASRAGYSSRNNFPNDDEISGNLFIISTAGFETTANTMGYAVMHLAAFPEWQAWVRGEVCNLDPDMLQWKYDEIFPRCHRTLALMFETLRLYTPTLHSTRYIAEPQRLATSDDDHLLMPPMDIYVAFQAIHCDLDIWGPGMLECNPSRWIDAAGMKMSQVEFVAFFVALFRYARCEPFGQEELEVLQEGLRRMMRDSVQRLTLQVRDSKSVKLRWVPDT
ncbi:cytochrome P450 monooxygenase [Aspergillus terreus]|uniref:Cytochrome P450 monooxygenase n=1 Tax=Aspergillus terreus TaxID=33178 RepID=A0A5M3YPN4_ASPTE|nr:hypothetical protein ATETN484_0002055900 [Aspergillus terreus]GFF15415.1 cytochrome P450 monooxygenase [Aspergillus terreus]